MEDSNTTSVWILRMMSVFFGIVIALFIGEIFVRVYKTFSINNDGKVLAPMYIEDDELGWKLKPNFKGVIKTNEFTTDFSTNARGFRDGEHSESDGDNYKIMGLGDSFTFGYGVDIDEVYLSRLDKLLNSLKDGDAFYEVYNISAPGYSIKEEYMLFERTRKEINPDLVILGLDINDHTDCINQYPKFIIEDGYLVTNYQSSSSVDEGEKVLRIKRFLNKHSNLYSYVNTYLKPTVFRKNREEIKVKSWECAEFYLNQINEVAKENGSILLIVYIPHRSQVHPGLTQDKYVNNSYFEDLNNLLEGYSKRNDILFIDLLPDLLEVADKGEQLYYLKTDAHWNPDGHMVAAQAIYRFILDNDILIL